MAEVTFDDTVIYYETQGQGPPLVLLNGVMMTTQSWVLQTSVLRRRYRCILHDFRCQLRSSSPEQPFTMATHAEDLKALLDHLGVDKAHLVGTSYGGEVGLIFGYSFPERVESLAIISSASEVGPRLRQVVTVWAETARETPERLYRIAASHNFSGRFMASSPDLLTQGEQRVKACPPSFFSGCARLCEAFLELDITDRLCEIRCPTLVVCGESDALKPPSYSRRIAAAIPGAELLLVADAGHAVVIERPGIINAAILGFLETVEARRPSPAATSPEAAAEGSRPP